MSKTEFVQMPVQRAGVPLMADLMVEFHYDLVDEGHPDFDFDTDHHVNFAGHTMAVVYRGYTIVDVVSTEPR